MDTRELRDKGLKLRREMLGREAVDARMKALGDFGEPLQDIINMPMGTSGAALPCRWRPSRSP